MIRQLRGMMWSATAVLIRRTTYAFLEKGLSQIEEGASVLNVGAGGTIEAIVRRHAQERKFHVTSEEIDLERNPDRVDDITKS